MRICIKQVLDVQNGMLPVHVVSLDALASSDVQQVPDVFGFLVGHPFDCDCLSVYCQHPSILFNRFHLAFKLLLRLTSAKITGTNGRNGRNGRNGHMVSC